MFSKKGGQFGGVGATGMLSLGDVDLEYFDEIIPSVIFESPLINGNVIGDGFGGERLQEVLEYLLVGERIEMKKLMRGELRRLPLLAVEADLGLIAVITHILCK